MRKLALAALAAGTAAIGGAIVYYMRENATPGPDYRTLETDGDIEVREYPALVVAETIIEGERRQALGDGFRRLADYIFAKSRSGEELPMTAPVLQDAGDPMASDPPLFDDSLSGAWRVRFVMPVGRDPDNLPEPPKEIALVEVAPRRVAAIRFAGAADDRALREAEDQLRGWLSRRGEPSAAEPEYAFYNSPMIPAPLRRNEVLIPLS